MYGGLLWVCVLSKMPVLLNLQSGAFSLALVLWTTALGSSLWLSFIKRVMLFIGLVASDARVLQGESNGLCERERDASSSPIRACQWTQTTEREERVQRWPLAWEGDISIMGFGPDFASVIIGRKKKALSAVVGWCISSFIFFTWSILFSTAVPAVSLIWAEARVKGICALSNHTCLTRGCSEDPVTGRACFPFCLWYFFVSFIRKYIYIYSMDPVCNTSTE